MFDFFKQVADQSLGTGMAGRWTDSGGVLKARLPTVFTCIVGVQNTSSARYHVNEVAEVQDVLQSLERANSRRHIGSVLDLAQIDASFSEDQRAAAQKLRPAASMPMFTGRGEEDDDSSSLGAEAAPELARRAFSDLGLQEEPLEF
jgi:hypothetical protein